MERSSQYLLVAILLLPLFGSVMCYRNINIHTDTSALMALKSQITSDPQNILLKNWTTETSVCRWVGVLCDSHHNRVSRLNISFMGLVGTIPSEIGNLSFLVSLDMNDNFFHGPIPPSIFTMPRLQVLILRNNSLSSSLPDNICKHGLHNLKRLRISYNEFYGEIPSTLGQCSQLEYLSLSRNNFSGRIPGEIGNITLLKELYLGSNSLSGALPREIGNMKALQHLYRLWRQCFNWLSSSLPDDMCKHSLHNLKRLSISENEFYGEIPSIVGQCFQLEYLSLSFNNFGGRIPSEIGNITLLKELYLASNYNLSGNTL